MIHWELDPNWIPMCTTQPVEWHIHLYNSTEKEKERLVQLKDYFYRCFSEYPISKSSHAFCWRSWPERGHRARTDQRRWERVHSILGQESEQRNQPTRPRARRVHAWFFFPGAKCKWEDCYGGYIFIPQTALKERSFSHYSLNGYFRHVHVRGWSDKMGHLTEASRSHLWNATSQN